MDRHSPEEHSPALGGPAGSTGLFRPLRLVIARGFDVGRRFVVGKAGATLGRAPDNTIVLADPAVSRQHAVIEVRGGAVLVSDCGSRHGTWVNGQRLNGPQPLRPGDAIEVGDTLLAVTQVFGSSSLPAEAQPAAVVYRTCWHERGASDRPVYALRGGQLYRTRWHERGAGRQPDYELHGQALYRTTHHERGASRLPEYEVRAGLLYRSRWHPQGASLRPLYRLAEPAAPSTSGPLGQRLGGAQ